MRIDASPCALPPRPKLASAAAFPEAHLPLLSTALLSSTASVWSQTGAAHYSAANAYLDARAAADRWAGRPTTAINFGPFADVGMAAGHVEGLRALGLQALQPREVYSALRGSGYGARQVHAALDVRQFRRVNTAKGPWSFLDQLATVPVEQSLEEPGSLAAGPIGLQLEDLASEPGLVIPGVGMPEVVAMVRAAAEAVLGRGIGADGHFAAEHFDSLSAVELSNELSRATALSLPGTLVFDYPSVPALAAHIHSLLQPAAAAARPVLPLISTLGPTLAPIDSRQSHQPAALTLSLVARLPEAATKRCQVLCDLPEDAISVVPFSRWDLEAANKAGQRSLRARFGGFARGVEAFDAGFFGIVAPEAELMDPQQRLLLEASWELLQQGAWVRGSTPGC